MASWCDDQIKGDQSSLFVFHVRTEAHRKAERPYLIGSFHLLSAPPPPLLSKDGGFLQWGLRIFSSDEADKIWTPRTFS